MSRKFPRLVAFLAVTLLAIASPFARAASDGLQWQTEPKRAFASAAQQHKPIFLYLEAVWCHWCHVMQAETFADSRVRKLLAERFVVLKVDHDANPLLANRYRDYGWPALIFFDADGREIVKRAGYRSPADFTALLTAIVNDPSPEVAPPPEIKPAIASALSAGGRAFLLERHARSYDDKLGGLRTSQKFIDRDSVEYALAHADLPAERRKAEQTLSAARALIDPVWGGIYQYSTGGDWQHPHYEKIMRSQAGALRIYALAWARLGRQADLDSARAIRDFLLNMLRTPDGSFRVSQDADQQPGVKAHDYFALGDRARRARGLPRIDPHRYADANGQAAEALAVLYETSADQQALDAARAAAQWLLKHRRNADGSFRHDEIDNGQRNLNDTLAPARAFLQLYRVSAEREWLTQAMAAADALTRDFGGTVAGYPTARPDGSPIVPLPDLAENISAARFFNLLHHYSGRDADKDAARHAMRYLAADAVVGAAFEEAGILLADDELNRDPLHLTVVGAKSDAAAQALYRVALETPGAYKRVEWWDPAEGPLQHMDVAYPKLPKAGGFVCGNGRCSVPSFDADRYARSITQLSAKP